VRLAYGPEPLVTAADNARFEALLESIHASVHAIAEGRAALIERCDRIETRLDRLEGKLEEIGNQLTAIDTKLIAIDVTLTAIDTKLTAIDTKLTAIDVTLTAIDVTLTAIDTKLDTFSVDTQSRLERIETHLVRSGPPRPRKRLPRGSTQPRKAA
jgi:chromosome segregation ATPase